MLSKVLGLFQSSPPPKKPWFTMNAEGNKVFNVDQLNAAQCEVVHHEVTVEARQQRYWAIAKGSAALITAVAIACLTAAIAKMAAPVFAAWAIKALVAYEIPVFEFLPLILKGFVATDIGLAGACAIKKLWNVTHPMVEKHLQYATHLDRQGLEALLIRGLHLIPKTS